MNGRSSVTFDGVDGLHGFRGIEVLVMDAPHDVNSRPRIFRGTSSIGKGRRDKGFNTNDTTRGDMGNSDVVEASERATDEGRNAASGTTRLLEVAGEGDEGLSVGERGRVPPVIIP